MKRVMCAGLMTVVLAGMAMFVGCKKKEPVAMERAVSSAVAEVKGATCGREITTDRPVKAGETGMVLPVGSKLCLSEDNLEVRVKLPEGFSFAMKQESKTAKPLPVLFTLEATYACYCSNLNSACNVFYADGMGFGCLQSSCTGSCTGKFTYKGYSVDRVAVTMEPEQFFELAEVKQAAMDVVINNGYSKMSLYGVNFFVVENEKIFLDKAKCDCEGTKACALKTIFLPMLKGGAAARKIYYCAGSCNGCELTVS